MPPSLASVPPPPPPFCTYASPPPPPQPCVCTTPMADSTSPTFCSVEPPPCSTAETDPNFYACNVRPAGGCCEGYELASSFSTALLQCVPEGRASLASFTCSDPAPP